MQGDSELQVCGYGCQLSRGQGEWIVDGTQGQVQRFLNRLRMCHDLQQIVPHPQRLQQVAWQVLQGSVHQDPAPLVLFSCHRCLLDVLHEPHPDGLVQLSTLKSVLLCPQVVGEL